MRRTFLASLVVLACLAAPAAHAEPGVSVGRHLFVNATRITDPDPEPGAETSRGVQVDVEPLAEGGWRTCVWSQIHYAEGGAGELFDEQIGCADGIASYDEADGWSVAGTLTTSGTLRDGSPSGGTVTIELTAVGVGSTAPGCSLPANTTARTTFLGLIEGAEVTGTIDATLPGSMPADAIEGCTALGAGIRTR